jgi:EmrB/QacA subfamily drug resistance transporter
MSTHFHVSGTGVTGPLAGLRSHYKWWVLVTAIFGAFVSILDATVVNTALPQIQRALGSDLHVASYVTTAYTLAQGVIMAASGFLANRFGIKRMYLLSLALFTLGSVLCGLAWNINILILFRVLQGAGGAALFPLSLSLIFGAFPEEQRGLANGIFGIPVLVAPALGPVIGGYLAEYVDWRWIFYVNVPIGIIGIVICWRMLHESELQPT